jgi:benzoyl-CoA reductase/2-hydroxyglutaryl-CoA dehydratase subunit BcrC/BadD/HgdB
MASDKILSPKKPIFACFPLYPPLELFHSMGFHPVVLWGLNNYVQELQECDRHVQVYVCSVARYLTQFLISCKDDSIKGIFSYNACDALRNLPEIISDALKENNLKLPSYYLHLPMGDNKSPVSRFYLKNEINLLINNLESLANLRFDKERFAESVRIYSNYRNIVSQLEMRVINSDLSYSKFIEEVQNHMLEPVEEQISRINESFLVLKESAKKPISNKESGLNEKSGLSGESNLHRTILSGILPPSPGLINIIEESGLKIVGNDIAYLNRSTLYNSDTEDIYAYYEDFYFNHTPCPTLLYTCDRRAEYLADLVTEKKASSIIFIGEKFCECEYFEFPFLKKYLKERGIKTLLLEIDATQGENLESFRTRLEAFLEIGDLRE